VQLPEIEVPALVGQHPQARWAQTIRAAYEIDKSNYDGERFPATLEAARGILHGELADYPRFFCMGRHLVESLVRIAALAPRYEETRIQRKVKSSPLPISRGLIESHLTLLATTGEAVGQPGLDTWAAPLQAKGIPIICNDVPPIPDPDQP
jgi:hypothetical protein